MFLCQPRDIQVITVAGRNSRLLRKLKKLKEKATFPVKVFGYTDRISDLMDASDVLITKAGPGTIMEAISRELPVIITGRTLSQEIGNVEFVRTKGLGWVASDRWEAVECLREIFEHRDVLNEIRGNIRNVKEPGGALKIARLIKYHF